jgi:hypothetical protein
VPEDLKLPHEGGDEVSNKIFDRTLGGPRLTSLFCGAMILQEEQACSLVKNDSDACFSLIPLFQDRHWPMFLKFKFK